MLEDILPAIDNEFLKKAGAVPFLVEGAKRYFSEGASPSKPSVHDTHELTYVRRGKVRFNLKGRQYLLSEENAIVIKPNQEHSYLILEGPCEMVAVYFGFSRPEDDEKSPTDVVIQSNSSLGASAAQNEKKNRRVSSVSIDEFFAFTGSDEQTINESQEAAFIVDGSYRKDLANLVERILEESEESEFAGNLMMRLMAIELVVVVSRALKSAWEKSLRISQGKARELVTIAREYIASNYDHDLSVADVANYVFLSQGYFARAFRDEVGMSPMAFMMKIRVEEACKLLSVGDLKISSIANRVGFSSPQRFNSAFRKHMGMSPMEYRRSLQENQDI